MADGSLIFDTLVNDKGFKDGIGELKSLASGTMNIVKGLFTVGVAGFTAMATAGLKFNSDMENYTTNFKVMLGDQEAALEKVNELKEMAAKTPFGLGELADATQTLLAFQVPAEQSTEVLRMLGDVALGNKEKLSGLALVYGQVASNGKLMGQDLLQMINQGFNPLNYIAQRTGESMEELRARMSAGAIGADEVKQAFIDATSEGGQFFNGMEEASKTLSGQMSTLGDTVNEKLGQAFSNIFNKLKDDIIPKVIEFVENIDVDKAIEDLTKFMNDTVIPLGIAFIAVATAVKTFSTAMAIKGLLDAATKSMQGLTIAQWLWNAALAANPIVLIISLIAGFIAGLGALLATNKGFRDGFMNIWKGIKDFWDATIGGMINGLLKLLGLQKQVAKPKEGGFTLAEYEAKQLMSSNMGDNYRGVSSGSGNTYNSYDVNIDAQNVKEFNDVVRMSQDEQMDSRMDGGY